MADKLVVDEPIGQHAAVDRPVIALLSTKPPDVALTTDVLAGVVGSYVVVSTVSAYREWPGSATTEDSPLWPSRPDARESDPDIAALPGPFAYGTLKAGCESVVREAFRERAVVLRPGVVLGPYEYVGRLEALLGRAARGGRMLVAGEPHRSIQPVDVRDLVAFMLDRLGQREAGTYNVVAPSSHATYGGLIDACVTATGGTAEPVWVEAEWLTARGVAEWTDLPLWRTPAGTWLVDGSRAQRAGLVCRPLADTVFDTWAWLQCERPVAHPRASEHGLSLEREADLLAEWNEELLGGATSDTSDERWR